MLQRLGWIQLISKKTPDIKRIWLHALSVGEVKSALPLVNALKKKYLYQIIPADSQNHQSSNHSPNYELIVTASTRTGFAMAQQLFSDMVQSPPLSSFFISGSSGISKQTSVMSIQIGYFPFDLPFSVKSISSRIDPDIVIIVESDLWPGFLWYMNDKKVPLFLVNARLSKSSFEGYKRFSNLFTPLFSLFEKIMVQTNIDKERFVKIEVPESRVVVTGNIKFDQETPKTDIPDLDKLKNHNQRYILAGSTHEGEEEILASVFRELKKNFALKKESENNSGPHDLKLIIAPRDPKRAVDIKKMLNAKFLISNKDDSQKYGDKYDNYANKDIIIIDKMGILASLYSICDIAFIGGSLVPCGGHNPLEAAIFSKPVIFGPHTDDFREITETMLLNGAALMVKDRDELLETITMLLNDTELAERVGQNAGRLVVNGRGAVEKILSYIRC